MDIGQAVPPGRIVYGADGAVIGTVESSDDRSIDVEGEDSAGTFSFPVTAIVETNEDGVFLSMTRDDALRQGMEQQPPEGTDRIIDDPGYSAIQGEESYDEDFDMMPGQS